MAFWLAPMYAPGAEQSRQNAMLGISIALTVIAMICVAMRIYTRAYIVRNIGLEDWTMMLAATFTMILLLQLIVSAKKFKMGFSGYALTSEEMIGSVQLGLAIIVVYKMCVTLIKISILFIYLRIAVTKRFERLCKGTILLLMVWQMIVTIIVPAQCIPLRKVWDFTGEVKGKCINVNAFYYTTSMFHILMDLWILALPIQLVRSIPRPYKEKLGLIFVFGLGILSTIASIVRFSSLTRLSSSKDPFFDSLPINTWSIVEVCIGIVCASVPTLRPLFSQAQRNRTREALKIGYPSGRDLKPVPHNRIISISAFSMADLKNSTVSESTLTGGEEEYELQQNRPPPVPPKDFNVRWSDRTKPLNSNPISPIRKG
ncbi:hypothetical protein BDV96DRAFT_498286 [Lophiotrema nucula]|uniref:Rhodopsin domain-containing protein n=1 Tax=Lophiotrema nucula TaxID=690887 RepID=A0A6A5Z0X6_9PLEO|nr:hypothetical protein BDV96DRAFT_498286 [Lophiotrema nucula]